LRLLLARRALERAGLDARQLPSPLESASAGAFNIPSSVACVSASDCWAAGYGHDGVRYRSLLLHWDGRRWSVGSPSDDVAHGDALLGVSCVSSSACWAVGLTTAPGNQPLHEEPLIERWDGTRWSTVATSTGTDEGQLAAVSCASRADCSAVGYQADAVDGSLGPLIERLHGGSWRTTPSQRPRAPAGTVLDAVSCASPGTCATVGAHPNRFDVSQPVAASLKGGRWVTTLTKFTGRSDAVLHSIACTALSACWAVGYGGNRGLISRWDGKRWSLVPTARDPSASIEDLYGVACASRVYCWAVGAGLRSAGWDALFKRWDGTRWTAVENAGPPAAGVTQFLASVTCASKSECWAVGTRVLDDYLPQPLIERWDGRSWSIVAGAAPGQADGYLADVTCNSADDCLAVGGLGAGTGEQALVEHWDGTAWRQVTTGAGVIGSDYLNGLSCRSPSNCWAVGSHDVGGGEFHTLTLHWDGSGWARVASPDAAAGNGVLTGVACSSARCWAVGVSDSGRRRRTLLLRWNGRRWATVSAPTPHGGATDHELVDITCGAATPACRAVGWWSNPLRAHAFAARYATPRPAGS
jgi:hypothetical protein